jgi:hypothetical protein
MIDAPFPSIAQLPHSHRASVAILLKAKVRAPYHRVPVMSCSLSNAADTIRPPIASM